MQRLHLPMALLYVYLVAAVCRSLPTNDGSINKNIHSILTLAQTTLEHIQQKTKRQVLSQIKVASPSINGLTGIISDLGHLDRKLQSPSAELWSQIQADVSSLEGRVRLLAQTMDCPVQDRPSAEAREPSFPISQHYETLAKLQQYLENLHQNKDKLTVC